MQKQKERTKKKERISPVLNAKILFCNLPIPPPRRLCVKQNSKTAKKTFSQMDQIEPSAVLGASGGHPWVFYLLEVFLLIYLVKICYGFRQSNLKLTRARDQTEEEEEVDASEQICLQPTDDDNPSSEEPEPDQHHHKDD